MESGTNLGSGDALPDDIAHAQQLKNELANSPEDLKKDFEVKLTQVERSTVPLAICVDDYDELNRNVEVKNEEPKPLPEVGKFEESKVKAGYNPERGRRISLLCVPVENHIKKAHMPQVSVNEATAGAFIPGKPEVAKGASLPGFCVSTVLNKNKPLDEVE